MVEMKERRETKSIFLLIKKGLRGMSVNGDVAS